MTKNELAIQAQQLTPQAWKAIVATSKVVEKSTTLGSAPALQTQMIVAWELGIPLAQAWQNVYIIDGKPSIAPKVIHGLVMRHPQFAGYEETELLDDDGNHLGWEIRLKRTMPNGNVTSATRRFTLDDARKAKIYRPGSAWEKYPRNMTYWRAIGHVEDVLFPDATFGFLRSDWAGAAVDEAGDVIEGTWETPYDINEEVGKLINEFGREAVSEVQGNSPDPTSEAEVNSLREKLEAIA